MRDGFRWTVTGGAIGILLLLIGSLIINKLLKNFTDVKFEWFLTLSMPLFGALIVWYVKYHDKIKKEEMEKIYKDIGCKADQTEVDHLKDQLIDHKENEKDHYDSLFEFLTCVDNKLDILIGKNIKK